jgi:hypothetical protein
MVPVHGELLHIIFKGPTETVQGLGGIRRWIVVPIVLDESAKAPSTCYVNILPIPVVSEASRFEGGGESLARVEVYRGGFDLPVLHVLSEKLLRTRPECPHHGRVDDMREVGAGYHFNPTLSFAAACVTDTSIFDSFGSFLAFVSLAKYAEMRSARRAA